MVHIDLTSFELFKSFAELEGSGLHIDLHNEFKCSSINFTRQKRDLVLFFESTSNIKIKRVEIIFGEVELESFMLRENVELAGEWTIDNIYRGRFENEFGELNEMSVDGRYYYYIDFVGDCSFELFAKVVKANISI